MSFWKSFRNIRYFFQWLADLFHTWFTPYHYNGDEDVEKADNAPDRMPKPTAPPAESTESTDATVSYADRPDTAALSDVMAFRGPMAKQALAAVLGKSLDEIDAELANQVSYGTVEECDDGRYLLAEHERRQALRADPNVSDWLARLQSTDLEDSALEILEQICRQLPVKILAGKSLVFHLRQRKWMIWQGRDGACRVRMFGTLGRDEWSHLREIDGRARRYSRKEPHRWDPRDWVTFRWAVGADSLAVESVMLEAGREFQKRSRRRRKPGRHRPGPPASQPISS